MRMLTEHEWQIALVYPGDLAPTLKGFSQVALYVNYSIICICNANFTSLVWNVSENKCVQKKG